MWSSFYPVKEKKIPAFHYMVAGFGGIDIECAKYATFGSHLTKNIVTAMNREGCLLANHGQLTVGKNLQVTSILQ